MDRLLSEQDVLDAICKVCVVEVKSSECRYGKGLFGGCAKYEAIKAIPSVDIEQVYMKGREDGVNDFIKKSLIDE